MEMKDSKPTPFSMIDGRIYDSSIASGSTMPLTAAELFYHLERLWRLAHEVVPSPVRTRHQIEIARSLPLNEAAGHLLRDGKSDDDFRKQVLQLFAAKCVIDPDTGRVNHPLGVGQRVQVAYQKGTIRGITHNVSASSGAAYITYDVCFDGAEYTALIDQHWVWPLDQKTNEPLQWKKP